MTALGHCEQSQTGLADDDHIDRRGLAVKLQIGAAHGIGQGADDFRRIAGGIDGKFDLVALLRSGNLYPQRFRQPQLIAQMVHAVDQRRALGYAIEPELIGLDFDFPGDASGGGRLSEIFRRDDEIARPAAGAVVGFLFGFAEEAAMGAVGLEREKPLVNRFLTVAQSQRREIGGNLAPEGFVGMILEEEPAEIAEGKGHDFQLGFRFITPVGSDLGVDQSGRPALLMRRHGCDIAAVVAVAAEGEAESGADRVLAEGLIDPRQPVDVERGKQRVRPLPELEFVHPGRAVAPVGGHHAAETFEITHIADRIFRVVEEYRAVRAVLPDGIADAEQRLIPGVGFVDAHIGPVDAGRRAAAVEIPDLLIVEIHEAGDRFNDFSARFRNADEAIVVDAPAGKEADFAVLGIVGDEPFRMLLEHFTVFGGAPEPGVLGNLRIGQAFADGFVAGFHRFGAHPSAEDVAHIARSREIAPEVIAVAGAVMDHAFADQAVEKFGQPLTGVAPQPIPALRTQESQLAEPRRALDPGAELSDLRLRQISVEGGRQVAGSDRELRFHRGLLLFGIECEEAVAENPAGRRENGPFVAEAGDGDDAGADLDVAVVIAVAVVKHGQPLLRIFKNYHRAGVGGVVEGDFGSELMLQIVSGAPGFIESAFADMLRQHHFKRGIENAGRGGFGRNCQTAGEDVVIPAPGGGETQIGKFRIDGCHFDAAVFLNA
ncbi:hypothetical protein SDC9_79306 [bioreactor metagenome]|uniref:Uncharacterized protein n=1 Tax=bioreactor metagenome TaxID=1076179 RepID=A0A644YY24_9ZZZZ